MTNIVAAVGLGLKPQHYAEAYQTNTHGLWYEVHAENYFVHGGPRLQWLLRVAQKFPLSLHGVGLSLGGDDPIDQAHLLAFKQLIQQTSPFLVSEHLAWSKHQGVYFPDLLPIPRTTLQLQKIAARIAQVQDYFQRPIAIENPTHYLTSLIHDWDEADFLCELVKRTGCYLLLDLNNVVISAHNLHSNSAWVDRLPPAAIAEIHLAGYTVDQQAQKGEVKGGTLWIDAHQTAVDKAVWQLYQRVLARVGAKPTLIEWDQAIPPFATFLAEHDKAYKIWQQYPASASNTYHYVPHHPPAVATVDVGIADWAHALINLEANIADSHHVLQRSWHDPHAAVYRNTVWSGWLDTMALQFPSVLALLGEPLFKRVARSFVTASPPSHAALVHYGAQFSDFLQRLFNDADILAEIRTDYADKVAALHLCAECAAADWCWLLAFTAAEAAHCDDATWQWAISQNRRALSQHPACHFMCLSSHAAQAWSKARGLVLATDAQQEVVLVCSRVGEGAGEEVRVHFLAADAALFLQHSINRSLADAVEAVLQQYPAADFAAIAHVLLQAGVWQNTHDKMHNKPQDNPVITANFSSLSHYA